MEGSEAKIYSFSPYSHPKSGFYQYRFHTRVWKSTLFLENCCFWYPKWCHLIHPSVLKNNPNSYGTVSVAVYGYRTHWFRRRIRLYNQNEAYNSVAVYGYGTNSPWNGSVAVQNRPLSMYESSQSFICAGKLRIDCFPDLCKLIVHYLHM